MNEPAESGPTKSHEPRCASPGRLAVHTTSAPVPEPLPLREMETIERELGVRRHRIASSPGVLAGPPMVPDAETLERLMSVWRFDEPQSTWASEASNA